MYLFAAHQRKELYHYMKKDRVWVDEDEEFGSLVPQEFTPVTVRLNTT